MKNNEKSLLVYTGRQKTPMNFIGRKDLFFYPFTQMISRTNYKTNFFNFAKGAESIDELKKIKMMDMTFEECCLKRAHDLLLLNKENYYVLYSGGIDSTGLIVALLKVWATEQLKKITIVLTSHSILENPSFFHDHIKKFRILNYMNSLKHIISTPNSIIVTGELGDQIFGSGMLLQAYQKFGPSILKDNYCDRGADVIEQYLMGDGRRGTGHGKALFDFIRPIADEAPIALKSCFDFFWWFNFTQEWQFAKYKYLENFDYSPSREYGSKIIHFYDTDYFQYWSINQHFLKIKDSWDSYKYLNKEFIYNYTKDPAHLNLLKLQSLKNTYFFQKFRIAVTEDQQEIMSYDELKPYAK